MAAVAGIDPASGKLAVVIDYDDGRVAAHSWTSPSKRWEPTNCISAYDWVLVHLKLTEPGTAWIEEPLVGRGGAHATIVQSFTSGAAQAALLHLGWDVRLVNVQRWKKHVVGSGRASKDAVGRHIQHRWPEAWRLVEGDGDLIDAAAIASYGRTVDTRAGHLMDGTQSLRA